MASGSAYGALPTRRELRRCQRWARAVVEGREVRGRSLGTAAATGGGVSPELPFSFVYDGRPSRDFLSSWERTNQSRRLDAERAEHTVTYGDPATGLVVRWVAVAYRGFPTVEWSLSGAGGCGESETDGTGTANGCSPGNAAAR